MRNEEEMPMYRNVLQLIGKTPMVALEKIAEEEQISSIFAKLERANPGGSVKDRVALHMINEAMDSGKLKKGMPVIEATSGNTGIGLAMVCAYLGFELVLTMPASMSVERRRILAAYGATLVLTDAALGMEGAVQECQRLVAQRGGFCPSQFDNPANPAAHVATAKEILIDMDGQVDAFVACVGTGGTISGVGRELKKALPNMKVIGVEPAESPLLSGGKAGPHGIQGIGANFVPGNFDQEVVDELAVVSTKDAMEYGRRLATREGLLCGISSGAALCTAVKVAREHGYNKVVCLLPDTGERYLSSEMFAGEMNDG